MWNLGSLFWTAIFLGSNRLTISGCDTASILFRLYFLRQEVLQESYYIYFYIISWAMTLASSLEVINNFFNLYNQEVTRTILSPTLFLYFLEKISGYIK